MKILILGMGLMGPSIAKDCAEATEVTKVLGCDIDEVKLTQAEEYVQNTKFEIQVLSVTDREALLKAISGYDVVINGTASRFSMDVLDAAMEAKINLVDLAGGGYPQEGEFYEKAEKSGITAIPGCGIDPGLIDILSGQAIMLMDEVDDVTFACGGLPKDPEPPLDYKIVFGGTRMPVRPGKVPMIVNGNQVEMDRYSEVESIFVEDLNPMEAFVDGYPSSLLKLCIEKGVKNFRGKTIRYSGFVDKILFLNDLGLISTEPINYEGKEVIPRELFHKIIYPLIKFDTNTGDRDLTVLLVQVDGKKDGSEKSIRYDMVDFYDEETQVTSMAKTTGYTAAIIARMLGRGAIKEKGIQWPVRIIHGELFEELLSNLRKRGVEVSETTTQTREV
ncbi:MAG: saccharopine dehydrogenase NADP-binding domain-containing protein [Candidatus Bathyarchaeota archaeon]|nr:saccharopine dehydrogenase NADP-binding domain-containing protein [Candidatus Bathyarchaeota archaeon]